MPVPTVPVSHLRLFEEPILASLATVMPDGQPQVNPVWCDYDGTYVRINSADGRQKDENLKERRFATLLLVDPHDPYFWLEVRGRVAEVTTEGADAHIDSLSMKYEGKDYSGRRKQGQTRVMYRIQPDRIVAYAE